MIKNNLRTTNMYRVLQGWFDPAQEGNPYKNVVRDGIRVSITLDGIARKTICIVR